jgi:cytochrome P450
MIFTGGFAPANFLIGNGIRTLLLNPEQMQKLQGDPTLIEPAVEELLRYESPLQWTTRRATEDIEMHGKRIHKNQIVIGGQGAANRDPARFTDPKRLDITRKDNPHIAFGTGPHLCIARLLARMIGQIAINTVLRRMPGLRLESDTPEWDGAPTLRGPKSVPVMFA